MTRKGRGTCPFAPPAAMAADRGGDGQRAGPGIHTCGMWQHRRGWRHRDRQHRLCSIREVRRPQGQDGQRLHRHRDRPRTPAYIDSYKPFEECTGVTIKYEGDKAFETQILVRAKAGNPPDIAHRPAARPARSSWSPPARSRRPRRRSSPTSTSSASKDWKAYGTVDGKFYAAPMSANVKSLVWYSPKEFKDNGYKVPTTLAELQGAVRQDRRGRQEAVVRRHRQR